MLTLKTKTARFEWVDDDVESVVTLSSEDDEATLVRKLKRIIALVEGEQAQEAPTMFSAMAQAAGVPAEALKPAAPTNGWAAAFEPPALPERLQGEVELIPPGEDA